jgi:hypothetical protein
MNYNRAHEINQNGLSLDDKVFILGGSIDPWLNDGIENYPEGTRYYKTDGTEYKKGASGSNPATDDFVEVVAGGGGGGDSFNVVEVSTDYTASLRDVVLCDASNGDLVITIPSATAEIDSQITIKIVANGVSNAYNVSVVTTDSSLFEGEDDMLLEIVGTSQTLISDGTDWRAI